ncbi:hypothetical protein GDO81_000673 [Engystomops pustulosus]|uniref:Caspase family p20 domain-containing protein n=1 Tax=Engystomops pustulosus TaxID=76066 RepID=A0AAV7D672_ENGPU|nr:hypothetical protein GDO81_000673 [Engystomops pustulosus]
MSSESTGQEEIDSRKVPGNKDGEANITETDGGWFAMSQALDPAAEYKMNHNRRGLALIFNHDWFFWQLRMPERRGTNTDRDNLYRRLTDLGFEVKSYDNLKAVDILETIHAAATGDHSDADCFLCVFMSHGEDNHVYAYDAKIEIQQLTSLFKGDRCQSLVGKPKIFIIQACRGTKHDEPVIPTDSTDSTVPETNTIEVDAASVYTLPAGADFIMCYSVAEGISVCTVNNQTVLKSATTSSLRAHSHCSSLISIWKAKPGVDLKQKKSKMERSAAPPCLYFIPLLGLQILTRILLSEWVLNLSSGLFWCYLCVSDVISVFLICYRKNKN